jgi:glycosyltransferase involved in cell wall biosynthesis
VRLNRNELLNYLFIINDDISSFDFKMPNILHILWNVYDVAFRENYPLNTNEDKKSFLYWVISNIGNTGVFYKKEILNSLIKYNHVINNNTINSKITPLLTLIMEKRIDLQNIFPNYTGTDNIKLWEWWIQNGYKEYKFDNPFSEIKNNIDSFKLVNFFEEIGLFNCLSQKLLKYFYLNLHSENFTLRKNKNFTTFMLIIYKSRKDLQEAFPDIHKLNKKEFFIWWDVHGEKTYNDLYKNENIEKNIDNEFTPNKSVVIIGHADGVLGLGEDARLISNSLKSLNISNDLYSSNNKANYVKEKNVNVKSLDNLDSEYYTAIFPLPVADILDILVRLGVDIFYKAKYNICITQWELPNFPKEYEFIKYLMDKVCSISSFSAASIEKTIEKRVPVIPLPFNTDVQAIPNTIKNQTNPYIFYFAFDGNSFLSRKNPLAVINSFQGAFKKNENVELIIKVMNSTSNDLWNECKRIAYLDNRIKIIDESLSREKYIELIQSINCLVSLHRAEGFGRIIAELMLLEKPVIVSNYSGNKDYNNSNNAFLVDGNIVPLFKGDYHLYEDNFWFEPSIDDASKQMQYVYNNQNEANNIAKNGRKTILDKYNFNKCGSEILNIINEIIIENSKLFDSKYYEREYGIKENAIEHYIKEGSALGYNPSEKFDMQFYVSRYSDVKKSNINPFVHYILHGSIEGRETSEKKCLFESINIEETKNGMIFISHDATKTGAPLVILDLCKEYSKKNTNFVIILMSGGELEEEFNKLAPVVNLNLSLFEKKDIVVSSEILSLFGMLVKKGFNNCIANTVVSGFLAPFLDLNTINTTYLIHEMTDLIEEYHFDQGAKNIINSTADIIFSSNLVAKPFLETFSEEERVYYIIPQGISEKMICKDKQNARKKILTKIGSKNPNVNIILGAGLAQDRKGTDLFLNVINECYNNNKIENLEFIWLGDKDTKYKKWERKELAKLGYKAHIHFIDFVEDPSDYFGAADIFLLTSREDPLPGVALIALKNNIPLIMFENTGGIQEYISDKNGSIIPQFDTSKMTSEIIRIIESGMKVESNISVNTTFEYFEKVVKTLERKSTTKVSVVIPNYNYEKYMSERLNSIINQTHKVDEIIFLDDCSKDNSVNVAREILEKSNIDFQIIENKQNAGVYRQWLKGFDLAKNDLVWIAEADDFAKPDFLESLIFLFDTNEQIGLAYTQSIIVDENSNIIYDDVKFHTDEIDEEKWENSYINDGLSEIEKALLYRNTIPNVSACLINKKYLLGIEKKILNYKYCGDWFLYSYLLNSSNIAFCHRSLNCFRKHTNNVTTVNTFKNDYIDEVLRIKKYIYSIVKINLRMHNKMITLFEKDFIFNNPNKNNIKEYIQDGVKFLEKNLVENLVFVTFNKEFGGSEVMWFDLANYLVNKNIKLTVLCPKGLLDNKKLSKLIENKVEIIEIDNFELNDLIELDASYVLFSIGDHNDGGEYFEYCFKNNIKYTIINQLVKEDMWTTDKNQLKQIFDGYKNANGTFFTCENNIDIFNRKAKIKLENAQVHFNPISIDRDDYVDYPEIKDRYCLAFPGRLLTIHKGQDILLKVLSSEKWLNRNILVNFYGVGPDKERLIKMVEEYNLNNVKFCGYVTDVRKIWESNHAFILTSHMEGIPIVLLGAMFAGRTAIVTNVGGNKEIIHNNEIGFIADKPNVESIDEALERAWKMRDKWEEMGKKARKDILEYYPLNPLLDFHKKLQKVFKW